MERDFLGAIGKDEPHQPHAEERKESDYFEGGGAPAMDWSFASRATGAPALMSFRSATAAAAREELKEHAFPHFSAFDGARKQQASHVLAAQKSFGAESHGIPQYAAAVHGAHRGQPPPPPHVLNGARVIPASSPFNPNNPMFRVQSSPNLPNVVVGGGGAFKQPPCAMNNAVAGSTVGVYGTRDVPKAKTAQLTIFYAGSVNVFNNVSPEKAQELMFLASRGSLPSAPSTVVRMPETHVFGPAKATVPEVSPTKPMLLQKPQLVSSAISKPISIVSQAASLPRSASSSNVNSTMPKSSSPLVVPPTSLPPSAQPETLASSTAAAIMPRAVPQARKASLARFLEKRKERVTTVAPYPSAKSPLQSSDTMGSANDNKSSCTDIALSSNRDESLSLGQPRTISFCEDSPSTKLQI